MQQCMHAIWHEIQHVFNHTLTIAIWYGMIQDMKYKISSNEAVRQKHSVIVHEIQHVCDSIFNVMPHKIGYYKEYSMQVKQENEILQGVSKTLFDV